jgi:hypothetical protein
MLLWIKFSFVHRDRLFAAFSPMVTASATIQPMSEVVDESSTGSQESHLLRQQRYIEQHRALEKEKLLI